MKKKLGLKYGHKHTLDLDRHTIEYINFKLTVLGLPALELEKADNKRSDSLLQEIAQDYKRNIKHLDTQTVGINRRINYFLQNYFSGEDLKTIDKALNLDYYGIARLLSIPYNADDFSNEYLKSYKVMQGVLHNPKNDRRTTKGSFHIVEGGLPIPNNKIKAPKEVFAKLFRAAVNPPEELLTLPLTANQEQVAKTFVSVLLRPIVQPKVEKVLHEMSNEVLFVVPGSLVSTLDFVESVFGNAGSVNNIESDAGIDIKGWTGQSGYVILAPHLTKLTKFELGLPAYAEATDEQKASGMCYKDKAELYNDGSAFKITARDHSGVAVTIIADNYFGYAKKEVKTQISFASNLFGGTEEEHAGGTIVYPRVNLGEHYYSRLDSTLKGYTFIDTLKALTGKIHLKPENYAIDKLHPTIYYLPEDIIIDLLDNTIRWQHRGKEQRLTLKPNYTYIMPNGSKIHIEKHPAAPAWKLVKTDAEGTFCHKPCTVSGGGKSEISKSLENAIIYGSYYVNDLDKALDRVQSILDYDYSTRFIESDHIDKRTILSVERTLGSVIKLLTPSDIFTQEYNQYIKAIPTHVKALVFMVKRFYKPEWGENWREHFTVDEINGQKGHEVNYNNRLIRPSYLRIGFNQNDAWRIFKLRMDFMPAEKIQMEDDISSSVVVNSKALSNLNPEYQNPSYKFTANCEYRFFQRPDEAINKGYDKQAEADLSSKNLFITNFQPLKKDEVSAMQNDIMEYIKFSEPVKQLAENFLTSDNQYAVISSEPRLINGKASKNPRYLENRSDITDPSRKYIADIALRLARKISLDETVYQPVNANLPGRRNNPASVSDGKKIRALSVYNPLHYQELPELFMDYISSLTGKSPSTTGAGSEGALTKAPFNMLLPIYDLNAALLSYILTDYTAFSTPAGHIGSTTRVDHDISLLIPELWARMSPKERNPQHLIEIGALKKVGDFNYEGELIPASRLGYRITEVFARSYLGKLFDEPQSVFPAHILKPEIQNMADFADGVLNIIDGHKKAAEAYFLDGSIEDAIPPLKALLHIMVYDEYQGLKRTDKEFRDLFARDKVINSDWYQERLKNKQQLELKRLAKIEVEIELTKKQEPQLYQKLKQDLELERKKISDPKYLESLQGTIGAEKIALV